MGAQPPDVQGLAFGVGKDESTGQPLDALQRDRLLAAELLAPPFPARQHRGMAGFGLNQAPLGAGDLVFQFVGGAANLVVDALPAQGRLRFRVT